MKNLFLIFFIFSFIFSLSISLSANGSDSTEIAWAKHIKKAIDNRPNPVQFSEQAAWQVLVKDTTSKDFVTKSYEHKYLGFYAKRTEAIVSYSRSSTSSVDGWWYTNTKKDKVYDWYFNFPLLKCIFILILISIVLNLLLPDMYLILKIFASIILSVLVSFFGFVAGLDIFFNMDPKLWTYYVVGINIIICIIFRIFEKK